MQGRTARTTDAQHTSAGRSKHRLADLLGQAAGFLFTFLGRLRTPSLAFLSGAQRSVIVAVPAVWMMKMVADAIVDMIAMRHRLVTAAGAVDMAGLVFGAAVIARASLGVLARHRDHVLVDVVVMRMVQVAIMQIIGMTVVTNGGVAAAGAVAVIVFGMGRRGAGFHRDILAIRGCDRRGPFPRTGRPAKDVPGSRS